MLRRDLATMLVASAAGSALVTQTASAQTCIAPCYPRTRAEELANVVPADTTYLPGDVRRYGGIGDGIADDRVAIQRAHDQGKISAIGREAEPDESLSGARPYLPPGRWRITGPIFPCSLGMYGDGARSSILECFNCNAFVIHTDGSLWNRRSGAFELFGIEGGAVTDEEGDVVEWTCNNHFAFYFPGAGGGSDRNSGFTVRDLAIDGFGGGFYLQDLFRATIENVGLTAVFCMIRLVGSVVQCSIRNVRSNNDDIDTQGRTSVFPRCGILTEPVGTTVCENVSFTDCAYIRGEYGIKHTAGLCVTFNNIDTETSHYGAYIDAECTMRGGILGTSNNAANWIGIFRGVHIPVSYNGTVFDGVDVNTLNATSAPAQSYGFELGDGSAPVHGLVIRNCRIRGTPASLADGIRGRSLRDATIEDNFFETACFVGTPININGRRMFVNRNRIPGGTIVIQDGGDTAACGEIEYNECTSLLTTLTAPTRWTIRNF
jgi:hypothetical protein